MKNFLLATILLGMASAAGAQGLNDWNLVNPDSVKPAAETTRPRAPRPKVIIVPPPTVSGSFVTPPIVGKPIILQESTPVRLRIAETVSSSDAHLNDNVEFEVLEEVKAGGVIVIPKGSTAIGTVTEAEPKRRMARGGKLEIALDFVRLPDGEKAAIRATKGGNGGGHIGGMTVGIVATAVVFWPAAPLFLLVHGKDLTIPKGTEFPAFVDGDMHLNSADFQD